MDTHRLRYFLRVAEEGSMNRAAGVLGMAQPALSRQVRQLESDLGVTLFRRTSRGVELTEEGERLRDRTSGPLRQLEMAMEHAGSPLARIERGVTMGLLGTVAPVLAAPLLGSLATVLPNVGFRVVLGGTDALVAGMLTGELDFALINPVTDSRVFCRDLVREELVAVGGPASGLRPDRPLPLAEVLGRSLVLPESPTGIRATLEDAAMRARVRIRSRFASDATDVVTDLAAADQALAVLPLSACAGDVAAGRLRFAPLADPVPTQVVATAATRQTTLPVRLATTIGDVIRAEADQLVRSGAWPVGAHGSTLSA